ncbi:MAG: hypothetical protein ACX93N_02080 [Pseudohaliea sp.]
MLWPGARDPVSALVQPFPGAAGSWQSPAGAGPSDAYRDPLAGAGTALPPLPVFRDAFDSTMVYRGVGIEPIDIAPAAPGRELSARSVVFSLVLVVLLGVYALQYRRRKRYARAARSRRHVPIVGRRARSRRRKVLEATRALHAASAAPSAAARQGSGSRGAAGSAGRTRRHHSGSSTGSGRSRGGNSRSGRGSHASRRRS